MPPSPSTPQVGTHVLPALALILAADTLLARCACPRPIEALLDESAHLATAFLTLAALPLPRTLPFAGGAALGAILIDADHVPMELGRDFLTRGTERPVPHSLPTFGALLLLSRASPAPVRAVLLGAACGFATHLLRDLGTGGVPLLWPLSKRKVQISYGVYAALLLAARGRVWWRARTP